MNYNKDAHIITDAIFSVFENWNIVPDPSAALYDNIHTLLFAIIEREQLVANINESSLLLSGISAAFYRYHLLQGKNLPQEFFLLPRDVLRGCVENELRVLIMISSMGDNA